MIKKTGARGQSMEIFNQETLEEIKKIVARDEFDDQFQNETIYDEGISGSNLLYNLVVKYKQKIFSTLIDIGCGSGALFGEFYITHALEPNLKRYTKARERGKKHGVEVAQGYMENIPFENNFFSGAISWGTFCFVRSTIESLAEVNRVLKNQGIFIFDVVLHTTLPIAQTVEENSFIKYLNTCGFSLLERQQFGPEHHRRLGLVVKKVAPFSHKFFLLPQMTGKDLVVNNYLESRDWYLR